MGSVDSEFLLYPNRFFFWVLGFSGSSLFGLVPHFGILGLYDLGLGG